MYCALGTVVIVIVPRFLSSAEQNIFYVLKLEVAISPEPLSNDMLLPVDDNFLNY